jgi:hypothetical protein
VLPHPKMLPSRDPVFDHHSTHWAATVWFAITPNLQQL